MPERQVITSLTGTVAPLLTINTTVPAQLDAGSFFLPRNWKKCAAFVDDDVILNSTGQSNLNQEIAFELPKQATQVTDLILSVATPPVTVTPAGNPANYVDFLGWAFIDYFRTVFGSNLVYDSQAYDSYFDYRKNYGIERSDAIDQMVYGNSTTATRAALLLNGTQPGQEILIPMCQPFSLDPMQALPIVSLSQKTRFLLRTNALANITQTPVAGTTLAYTGIFEFLIRLNVIHTTGPEADMLLELSRDVDGISYMMHQHMRMNSDTFANVQTGYVINSKLSGISKPIKDITWALIPTKMINNTGRNDSFFFYANPPPPFPLAQTPYSPIVSWWIDANGLTIQRAVPRNYSRLYKYFYYYEGFAGEDVYTQSYTRFPLANNACGGYLDYTNLNNPVLHIVLGAGGTGLDVDNNANPQQLSLIVNARDYNFWYLKSGKVFFYFFCFFSSNTESHRKLVEDFQLNGIIPGPRIAGLRLVGN